MAQEDRYYWAIIGRIPFADEDDIYCTDLPSTRSEALDGFHQWMRDEDPDGYRADGLIITAVLRSTERIDLA